MFLHILMPGVLLSLCVITHALIMTALLGRLSRFVLPGVTHSWLALWMLIRIAIWIIGAHLFEIAIWASFYTWVRAFPDMWTSFYFSAVTYTTTGYGDLVLPAGWRLFAAVEGLTGILMCGWSTGVFFAVVSRMYFGKSAETPGVGGVDRR